MGFFESQSEAIGGNQIGYIIVGAACFYEENTGLGRAFGEADCEGTAGGSGYIPLVHDVSIGSNSLPPTTIKSYSEAVLSLGVC
jgi:hypothetical protein